MLMRVVGSILAVTVLVGCAPALQYAKQPSDSPTTEARFQADREACGNVMMPEVFPLFAFPVYVIQRVRAERATACMKARGWQERGWHPPFHPDPDPVIETLPSRTR